MKKLLLILSLFLLIGCASSSQDTPQDDKDDYKVDTEWIGTYEKGDILLTVEEADSDESLDFTFTSDDGEFTEYMYLDEDYYECRLGETDTIIRFTKIDRIISVDVDGEEPLRGIEGDYQKQ